MSKQTSNNIKLGVFVLSGLLLLIVALYTIGKNKGLFTSSFQMKARFRNVEGLMPGNNVRYAGIQAGTVKNIHILSDTVIEVSMLMEQSIRPYIRKNSQVSIGTEGLMGNKVVDIVPGTLPAPLAEENDILQSRRSASIGDALETLYQTNDNAAVIASELVKTVRQINNSPLLERILYDTALSDDLAHSFSNIRAASIRINRTVGLLESVLTDVRQGKGAVGLLLSDTGTAARTDSAIRNIQNAGREATLLLERLDSVAGSVQSGLDNEGSLMHALIQDTSLTGQINRSLEHIENGTKAFHEDMEALKHNFLFRGYFKKKDKKKER